MDWEAPADAWYVWIAVMIITFALAGMVLAMPSSPPPDANQAANTIDRVTGSTGDASGAYEHDADRVKIDQSVIVMKNDGGTDRASLHYEDVVPVQGNEELLSLLYGAEFEDEYGDYFLDPEDHWGWLPGDGFDLISAIEDRPAVEQFIDDVDTAYEENTGEWFTPDGELTVHTVSVNAYWFDEWAVEEPDGKRVDVEMTDEGGLISDRPDEVTFSYSVSEETELELQFLDSDGSEFNSESITVDGSGEVALEIDGGMIPGNWESYPVQVGAVAGDKSGTATLTDGEDDETLVRHNDYPSNQVVAENFDWLHYDSEQGEYYVTLVMA